MSLLDPFGLSPQINVDWGGMGHGVLSLLGMIPGVGSVFDAVNAYWYFSEGNYFDGALSLCGALPGLGDIAVAGAEMFNICTKYPKMFRYAARLIGNAGNMALAAPKATEAIIALWDKHVIQGKSWDSESTALAIESASFGITAVLSAKNLGETIANFHGEMYDIVTSQCFVEGILVLTADGDKPIEEIQAGDLVYSTDPETGESEYKEVLRTFRKESDVLIHIFVNGEEIETTPVHPFWVEDKWVAAKDLESGDILTLADGTTASITQTYGEKLDEPVIVYNFEVAEFHTYYVTDTGVLVHNANKSKYSETFVRYCSEDEAIKSNSTQELQPHTHNNKPTNGAKWISKLGKERKLKSLGRKGHDYQIIIKTTPDALKWLEDNSINIDTDATESLFKRSVLVKSNESGSYGIGADLVSTFNVLFKPKISYRKIK